MSKQQESLDRELQSIFTRAQAVPQRDANAARRGRALFLQQARDLGQAVSPPEKRRHKEWFKSIPKERFAMLTTILVILGLLFGGSGATVVAAQGSMPGETLYPVKAWSETVRSELTTGPEARYELMLQYAEQRAEEIQYLAQNGDGSGDRQLQQLQLHLEDALQQTTRLQDQDMQRALTQLRDQIRLQDQTLQQVQQQAGPRGQALLERARQTLQTCQQLAAGGLADPQTFRQQEQSQSHHQMAWPTVTTAPADDTDTAVEPESAPQGVVNPWTTGTPAPGSGYGPGPGTSGACTDDCGGSNPWTTGTPTPGSGYGSGAGGGSNPWTAGTPTPGSGYGPGPGTGGTCVNDCDGNPNPGNPDMGGNGGGGSGSGSGGGSGSGMKR